MKGKLFIDICMPWELVLTRPFVNAAQVLTSSCADSAQERVGQVCEVLPINAIIKL